MAIPESIKKKANQVRNEVYGKDVREALASGIEEAGDIADQANTKSNDAVEQVDNIQAQVNQLVVEGDSSIEAAQARVDAEGKSFPTLKARLDEKETQFSSQLVYTSEYFSKKGLINKKTPRPMITWIDDDGRDNLYKVLYPIFKDRGIPFTGAIIPERIGDSGYVTEEELKEMMKNGLEVVSHTNEHDPNDRPINLPKERLRKGYATAKEKIIEWGGNPKCIVYPFGDHNAIIESVAREFHDYAIDISGGNGLVLPPFNMFKIPRYNPFNKSVSEVKKKLDEAYEKNAWVIIISHANESSFDKDLAEELIDYALSIGLEFVTTKKGIEYHGNLLELDGDNTIDMFGNIHSRKLGVVYRSVNNEFLASTPPESFKLGVTITKIDQTSPDNTIGLPADLAGTLITYKSSTEGQFTHQMFLAFRRSLVAYRSVGADGNWREWIVPNYVVQGEATFDDTTPPKDFPMGETTVRITQPAAQDTPNNLGGILKTIKSNHDNPIFTMQEFKDVVNGDKYERVAENWDSWSAWINVTGYKHLSINELDGTSTPDDFPIGITHVYVSGRPDGLPGVSSGNLITYKENGVGRSYQEFRAASTTGSKYFRGETNTGNWGSWKKFVFEDV